MPNGPQGQKLPADVIGNAVYSKLDIAREYLDTAIEFFLAGERFFA